jgi:hypothetical protein
MAPHLTNADVLPLRKELRETSRVLRLHLDRLYRILYFSITFSTLLLSCCCSYIVMHHLGSLYLVVQQVTQKDVAGDPQGCR